MPTRNMANRNVETLTLCRVRSSTFSLNQAKSRGTTILRPTILSIISRNICSMLQSIVEQIQPIRYFHKKASYFELGTEWNAEKAEKTPIFAKKSAHNEQL